MSDTESPNKEKRPLPSTWARNPYQAPTAHVKDVRASIDDTLAAEPNKVAAGRGLAWWQEGWRLFREAPALWIGIGVVLVLINLVIGMVPLVNLLNCFIFPVFSAGLMLGCHSLESGEELRFGHLFAGFQDKLGRLMMIGVLYLLGFVAIFAVVLALGFGSGLAAIAAGGRVNADGLHSGILLGSLAALLLAIPLMMSVWFAPVLVALHDLPAFEAMKLSFRGIGLRNFLPFLLSGLAFIVLAVLATVALGLGWLVLIPLIYCSAYASYRDIFTKKS